MGRLNTDFRAKRDSGRKLLVPYITGGLRGSFAESWNWNLDVGYSRDNFGNGVFHTSVLGARSYSWNAKKCSLSWTIGPPTAAL